MLSSFIFESIQGLPMVAFLVASDLLYCAIKRDLKWVWLVATLWVVFGIYEIGINWRMLCWGMACENRPDLPYVLAALVLPTVYALYQGHWGYRRV